MEFLNLILQFIGVGCMCKAIECFLTDRFVDEEVAPSQREFHLPPPSTITTKEKFLFYLYLEWSDDCFIASDVCPEAWTLQKTAAVLRTLTEEKKLIAFTSNGRRYFYISS